MTCRALTANILHSLKRALHSAERAPYSLKRALVIATGINTYYICKIPIYLSAKIVLYSAKRALYSLKRALIMVQRVAGIYTYIYTYIWLVRGVHTARF